jgi:hypothetical protein
MRMNVRPSNVIRRIAHTRTHVPLGIWYVQNKRVRRLEKLASVNVRHARKLTENEDGVVGGDGGDALIETVRKCCVFECV